MEEHIGPALPPHLMKKIEEAEIGPAMPPSKSTNTLKSDSKTEEPIGPIGPALPPGFIKETQPIVEEAPKRKVYGPSLDDLNKEPLKIEEEDEDDFIVGPPRPSSDPALLFKQNESEEKSSSWEKDEWKRIRDGEEAPKGVSREEWMTSIPEGKNSAASALQPRQFSKKGNVGQFDKSWMANPNGKEEGTPQTKNDYRSDLQQQMKDDALKQIDSFKGSRGPSLLEMHQQNTEGTKRKNEPVRPFDREKDVTTRYYDPAKKRKMITDAKGLDTNFTRGTL